MRLVLDRRARRLLRMVPRTTAYSAVELVLLGLLGVQCARLLLVAVTPVGSLGPWRMEAGSQGMSQAVLGSIDPFFRLSAPGAGPVVVTALDLKLFGIRADQASGRGSAIIGLPDGAQASYAVGEEIMPGVMLKAVTFDSITVLRGQAEEQLFLDQSAPANNVAPATQQAAPNAAVMSGLAAEIGATPRVESGKGITGVTIAPRGAGAAFEAAGFVAGDVITAINGVPMTANDAAQRIGEVLAPGSNAAIEVERGGKRTMINVAVPK